MFKTEIIDDMKNDPGSTNIILSDGREEIVSFKVPTYSTVRLVQKKRTDMRPDVCLIRHLRLC